MYESGVEGFKCGKLLCLTFTGDKNIVELWDKNIVEPELTFEKAFELAVAAESADNDAKDLQ